MDQFESILVAVHLFITCLIGAVVIGFYYHLRQFITRVDGFVIQQRVTTPRIELIASGVKHEAEGLRLEIDDKFREVIFRLGKLSNQGQCKFGCHSTAIAGTCFQQCC